MTPNEIYKLDDGEEEDKSILCGIHYNHIPEAGLDRDDHEIFDRADWITIKIHGYHEYDYRRYWRLASVWFMNKPVMIIQNAGREGDDHSARFITDVPLFWQMIAYLQSLKVFNHELIKDAIDPDKDNPNLTSFYDLSLRESLHMWAREDDE
jgi:hypothetical protein